MSLDKELLDAARNRDTARVRELLRKGANANARDEDGWTPAARRGC